MNQLKLAVWFLAVTVWCHSKYFIPVAHAQEAPLIAHFPMEPDGANANRVVDAGPLKLHGRFTAGVRFDAGGHNGQALYFSGEGENLALLDEPKSSLLHRLGSPVTITMWVKPETLPAGGKNAFILAKRPAWFMGAPYGLAIEGGGKLYQEANNGKDWSNRAVDNVFKAGEWTHLAFSHAVDGDVVLHVNGREVHRTKLPGTLSSNEEAIRFGYMDSYGGNGVKFKGWLDDVRFYAAPLSMQQIQADRDGKIATRTAQNGDIAAPLHFAQMRLVRWDWPRGFAQHWAEGGPTRRTVERRAGPDAVDWPQAFLDGQPIFKDKPEHGTFVPLREEPKNRPLFQQLYDHKIAPGNHWLRAVQWIWGQRYLYTTDRTARTWGNDYELWTFPILIKGEGNGDVRNVVLKHDGKVLYEHAGPLRSLTLQLPQNEAGKPYEISVANREAKFEIGLQPIVVGAPRDELIPLNISLPGTPKITIQNAPLGTFPHQSEWEDDLRTLEKARVYQASLAQSTSDAVPLLAHFAMEPDADDKNKVVDSSPLKFNGQLMDGATFGIGRNGQALKLIGGKSRAVVDAGSLYESLRDEMTFTTWIKPESLEGGDRTFVISSRPAWWEGTFPFDMMIGRDGNLGTEGSGGLTGWATGGKQIKTGEWQHVAWTMKKGGDVVLYLNGQELVRKPAPPGLTLNKHPLVFGYEEGKDDTNGLRFFGFKGLIDEAKFYSVALSPAQLQAEMNGTLKTRAAIGGSSPLPSAIEVSRPIKSLNDYLGIEVPRAPIQNINVMFSHGMSGGHFMRSDHGPDAFNNGITFPGTADEYARYLRETGYDMVFEWSRTGDPAEPRSMENLLQALLKNGVRGGVHIESLNHSNIAFFASTLPDYHAPKFRDVQLLLQRWQRFPNFAGATIGTDNGGYVSFWDWAPPIPNRPWGEAFMAFQNGRQPQVPVGPLLKPGKDYEVAGTQKQFIEYINRYDKTFENYGYFDRAAREVDPKLIFTTGSFGSNPGVGGRGGWPWATIPGKSMHQNMRFLQTYDWNEERSTKPLHNVALIDRVRSYFPDKPTFAILDDFLLHLGREARGRTYAMALTRGITAIGSNWVAHPTGKQARPQIVAAQKEVNAWVHRFGGAYAGTEPLASIGILYVHEQAVSRPVVGGADAKDEALLRASHEGKTTEALFLCHQGGWPARIVTPEELQRGLRPDIKVLLLTGLNPIDDTWHWWDGLQPSLQKWVAAGGKVLLDEESTIPAGIAVEKSGLKIRGYVTNRNEDWTPELMKRNAQNIELLRATMTKLGVPQPLAVSGEQTIWAVPHQTGNVQYVTVLNHGWQEGTNASEFVKPQTGKLKWNSQRPIYDLRASKVLSAGAAQSVDLTKDGFQVYALPPAAPTPPTLTFRRGADDFYYAWATVGAPPMKGVPVQLTVSRDADAATVYGASGTLIPLPIREGGEYQVTATELLSGQSGTATLATQKRVPILANIPVIGQLFRNPAKEAQTAQEIADFASRKEVPLVVALTPAQADDAQTKELATRLLRFFRDKGRTVSMSRIEPGAVVQGLQAVAAAQNFPRWKTVEADLVILGSVSDNPLLLDQLRGYLLPAGAEGIGSGKALVDIVHSPFVGERDVLNIMAGDVAGLEAGVTQVAGKWGRLAS